MKIPPESPAMSLRSNSLQAKTKRLREKSRRPDVRGSLSRRHRPEFSDFENSTRLVAFSTKLGWVGMLTACEKIRLLKSALPSRMDVLKEFKSFAVGPQRPNKAEKKWIDMIQRFTEGELIGFSEIPIETETMTDFQKNVVTNCRQIPYGQTLTYGALAAVSGSPNAARAVGSVMRKNNFPLIVPCHRVVASNGIGGFSAPNGIETKRQLLALEGVVLD